MNNGELRDDIDLETISYVLMGISNFVGLQILFRESLIPNELDKIVDDAMKILNNGILNKNI